MEETLITNQEERENLQSFASDNAHDEFHRFSLRELELELVGKYFPPAGNILDVGCGYGRTTVPLAELGFKVVGIDVVPRMIEEAHREYPGIDFRTMSATAISFPGNYFDGALFSFNGLDYIYPAARRIQALREIYRVLRPGGILILSSHNRATLVTKFRLKTLELLRKTIMRGYLFSNYVVAPHDGGDQITYCKMPWFQKQDFQRLGFQVVRVKGKNYASPLAINLLESWPHYVLRKP